MSAINSVSIYKEGDYTAIPTVTPTTCQLCLLIINSVSIGARINYNIMSPNTVKSSPMGKSWFTLSLVLIGL